MYQSDIPIEIVLHNGERFIKKEPCIEEITTQDYKELLKDIMKSKPQRFGAGEFQIQHCDTCCQEMILHRKQTFCAICKNRLELVNDDVNFDFDELFQKWQADKNFIENILYGNSEAKLWILDPEEVDPKIEEL